MTETEKAALSKLSPEELFEGFVLEAKLSDPSLKTTTVAEMNEHVDRFYAYAAAIGAQGGLPSLLPLLDSSDNWLAYRAADRLADLDETKERALSLLDRIAEARAGAPSSAADTARNMIRFGHPLGETYTPRMPTE